MKSKRSILASVFVLMTLSVTAWGQTYFKSNSEVPRELQTYIAEKFEEKCRLTRSTSVQLEEVDTKVQVAPIDQGMVDFYYTTTFKAYRMQNNHKTGFLGQVVVESVQYAFQNGENREVQSIRGPQSLLCR